MGRTSRVKPRPVHRRIKSKADQQVSLLHLLQDVGSAADQEHMVEAALVSAVSLIAEHQHWAVGHAYLPRENGAVCVPTGAWYVRPGLDANRFRSSTSEARFRRGEELVGRVLESKRPLWIADLHKEPRFTRDVRGLGLKSAVFFPVLAHGALRAVLEFYADHLMAPVSALEPGIELIALRLARVLERHELARRTAMALEQEQRQIGQELHDRLGQSLSALDWMAQSFRQTLRAESPEVTEKLAALVEGIGLAKIELRRLARGLMPLDLEVAGGFASALDDLAARCREVYGIECVLEGDRRVEVGDSATAAQMFRIAQEAVRNAAEHGHPTRIVIHLRADPEQLALEVRDNGAGFEASPAPPGGMGVRIMQHRAGLVGGKVQIHSTAAEGTVVRCLVPVTPG